MSHATRNLYESILHQLSASARENVPTGSPLPPARPSAAVIPWRYRQEGEGSEADEAGGIEVFWIQRAESLPFMGGWHAFPGGALSRSDAAVPVTGEPAGAGESGPAAGSPESLRG